MDLRQREVAELGDQFSGGHALPQATERAGSFVPAITGLPPQ